MKTLRSIVLVIAALASISMAFGCEADEAEPPDALDAYYGAIDVAYSLGVTEALSSFGTNPDLGFRTSGSQAEKAASEYIYNEMQQAGLANVRKETVTVDAWHFSKAELTYEDRAGREQKVILAAYPAQFYAEDEEIALIYAGKGTESDFADIDAEGKLALIEIDQSDGWHINWPAYQAKLKGARAVIAVNAGGYGPFNDETLTVRNARGPADAPIFSIAKKDGDILMNLIKTAEEQHINVKLTADSQIEKGGTSYAVIGEIPGSGDETLYMAGHYDGYFDSFDDNASGIGAMLGIAKALTDSGYAPDKTIRFIAHPSGKWGLCDSRYDWGAGAYQTIQSHLEWVEDAFALISIDGGVTSNMADGIKISASAELGLFAMDVGIRVEGNPFEEFYVEPLSAQSEAFPYARAGIPVICSGYSGVEIQTEETHDTNMDTKDYFYYEEAFLYSHKLYGTYLIKLDKSRARPLDYVAYFEMLREAAAADVSGDTRAGASGNEEELANALDEAIRTAKYLNAKIDQADWASAEPGDVLSFNRSLGKIYKHGQDELIALDWDDELIFAHERLRKNISALSAAEELLRKGNGRAALDECLAGIDLNRYAYAFDKETVQYFIDQVLGPYAENAWGAGYISDNVDLYDVIKSIQGKVDSNEVIDYLDEIEALNQEISDQQKRMDDTVKKMTRSVISMTKMMNRIVD